MAAEVADLAGGGPGDSEIAAHRATLWCCLGAGFATLLDGAIIAFTAPAAEATLGLGDADIQWFLASFSLTFGLGLAPAGRLGDAYGRRGLFIAGLVVFLVGAVASAVAPSALSLIAGRLVQGFGAGFISAQVLGVIQDTFTGPARLRALAGYTTAGAAAAIAGPMLAGLALWTLPADLGWRVVLLLPVPFTLATIALGVRGLPRKVNRRRVIDLDLPAIAALGLLVVTVTMPVVDPDLSARTVIVVAAVSVLVVAGLACWERGYARRGRLPLFAPALMRSEGFVTGNLVALLWFGSSLAFLTVKTMYFLQVTEIIALVVATAMIPSAVGRIVAAHRSQWLFARFGSALVPYGLALQTLSFALATAATLCWDGTALFAVLSALQIVSGVAGGLVEPPLRAVTLSFAPASLHGVAASFLQLTQRLSATFCIALATGVLLAFGATASLGSLRAALLLCAAVSGAATLASFSRHLRAAIPGARQAVPTP
ncbi:MFS transporter [Nocardia bovistercoris]|uniref:MFS transporter n=1 Tax=Nocardia bovistercoris TaxID=2785916 RepID=A0A931IEZ0_9NOCA|nr:MFS transporter [Nocardia bovistercoris]